MSITIDNKEYYGIIYKIENTINNKVYIGQTTEKPVSMEDIVVMEKV